MQMEFFQNRLKPHKRLMCSTKEVLSSSRARKVTVMSQSNVIRGFLLILRRSWRVGGVKEKDVEKDGTTGGAHETWKEVTQPDKQTPSYLNKAFCSKNTHLNATT